MYRSAGSSSDSLPSSRSLQNGDGGEALGHRRDAEDGVRIDRRVGRQVANAAKAHVRETAVDDHAVRVARHPAAGFAEDLVDGRKGGRELLGPRRIRKPRWRPGGRRLRDGIAGRGSSHAQQNQDIERVP